jgi:outer membrane receptor protein involved in Fe transport
MFGAIFQNSWYYWLLNLMKKIIMKQIFALLSFVPTFVFSQVSGIVYDKETNETVPYAQIRNLQNNESVLSDLDGAFALPSSSYPARLVISVVDYNTDTLEILTPNTKITLKPLRSAVDIGPVVVSASRRKQNLEEITISMDIIKPDMIKSKGMTDVRQAIDQAPGVSVSDGQVSIRGGSGFAYGAGSRVAFLWNEVPLITADAGDVKWSSIPIESVGQIEIIKGASSVLYGSGALNGIISVSEKEPSIDPSFQFKMQSGVYDNPHRLSNRWWGPDNNPRFHQADVAYSQQYKRFGLNLGAAGYTSDGFRKGETEDRIRLNGTLFYRPSFIKNLKFQLGFNGQTAKNGNFILWQSDSTGYTPLGGADTSIAGSSLTYFRGLRLSVDPTIKYTDRWKNKHSLRTRGYFVDNYNFNNPGQAAYSQVMYADYQFQRAWNEKKWVLTSGTTHTKNIVRSTLFGDHTSYNGAIYTQGEYNLKRLNIAAGMRAEYFTMDGKRGDSDYQLGNKINSPVLPFRPVFRTGVHYKLFDYTHLRGSFGQGVRYPSVAERYTLTSVGGLNIFPNATVRPETGWALEFGLKQGVKIGSWKGFIDAAVFQNNYKDMMEFTFGNYKPDSIPISFNPNAPGYYLNWIGFQAQNAEQARITGAEFSIMGEGEIADRLKMTTLIGYTYMNPIVINPDSAYLETYSDTSSNMLKYRFKHLAKADVQLNYLNFNFGVSCRFNTQVPNIDRVFEEGVLGTEIVPGLKKYRTDNSKPNLAFDARIGYTFKEQYSASFIINNFTNAELMGRPGDLQAPRTFVFQLGYKF